MLKGRSLKLPVNSHVKLLNSVGTPLSHPDPYQSLVGKLIYLTITRPDITYTVYVKLAYVESYLCSFSGSKRSLKFSSWLT